MQKSATMMPAGKSRIEPGMPVAVRHQQLAAVIDVRKDGKGRQEAEEDNDALLVDAVARLLQPVEERGQCEQHNWRE